MPMRRCALASMLVLAAVGCGTKLDDSSDPFAIAARGGTGAGSSGAANDPSRAGVGADQAGSGWVDPPVVDAGQPPIWDAGQAVVGVFLAPVCTVDLRFDLSSIQLAQTVDFISWRTDSADQPSTERSHFGTACATAQDVPGCQQWVGDLSDHVAPDVADEDGGVTASRDFLLTTLGDSVNAAVTPAAQAALLGTIDSEQEAMLRVALSDVGLDPSQVCTSQVQARRVAGGFEVQFFHSASCAAEQRRTLVSVRADGYVSLISDEYAGPGTCVIEP